MTSPLMSLTARLLAVLASDIGRTDEDLAGLLGVSTDELSPAIGLLYRQGRADRCGPYIVAVPPPRCPACEYRLPAHAYDCPTLPEPDGTDDALAILSRASGPAPGSGTSRTSGICGTRPAQRGNGGFPRPGQAPEPSPPSHATVQEDTMTTPHTRSAAGQPRHLVDAALWCAVRGWRVFPLRPGEKRPAFPDHDTAHCTGRDPKCRNGHTGWEPRATTDPDRIRRAWAQARYNVGIATGPSGLLVIDLDKPKSGKTPPRQWARPGVTDGADVLAALCELHGQPFPSGTFMARTRRGGLHLYFTAPPGTRLKNTSGDSSRGLGWLIDTRGHGGYVVAPGSFVDLPDGAGHYEVACDRPPAPLPDWLTALLNPASRESPHVGCFQAPGTVAGLPSYADAALGGEVKRVLTSPDHGHNWALNKGAFNLGRRIAAGVLDRELAEQALQAAGETAHTNETPARIRAVIRAGIDAGIRKATGTAA